jgi:protein-L-isoaspartate(D-aspartate) O-methyltransferase
MTDSNTAKRQYADSIGQAAGLQSDRLVRALVQVPRENFLGRGPWKILRPPNIWNYEDTPDDDPAQIYQDVLVTRRPFGKTQGRLSLDQSGEVAWQLDQ